MVLITAKKWPGPHPQLHHCEQCPAGHWSRPVARPLVRQNRTMLPFLRDRSQPQGHPLLEVLPGQPIVHTRVAARGTWTITARGWVLHSRIQLLDGDAVGLRDARLIGATITTAEMLPDGTLGLVLQGGGGHLPGTRAEPRRLTTVAPWHIHGPQRAMLQADEKGNLSAAPPGPPVFATPEALAEFSASEPSGIEQRLLRLARDGCLHPGHVVELLANAGALQDAEFERRGPILLSRMLARGELRAGFFTDGSFHPWPLSLPETVEHIGAVWTAIGGRAPGPDTIAWFEITEVGQERLGLTGPQSLPPGMSGYDSPGVVGGFR